MSNGPPATDAEVDELMRRAQDASAEIVIKAGNQKWDTPARSPIPTATSGRSAALTAS
jgi:hypothetical protein